MITLITGNLFTKNERKNVVRNFENSYPNHLFINECIFLIAIAYSFTTSSLQFMQGDATLSITTLSTKTLHNVTRNNDTQCNDTQHRDTKHNGTQHKDSQHNNKA